MNDDKHDQKRAELARILSDLRFNKGHTRKWIVEQTGINKQYVSFATSNTRRSAKKRDYGDRLYICPIDAVNKLYEWSKSL